MWRDEGYLLEMLLAAQDARTIAAQISEQEFRAEIRNQFAPTKALELIGEAARRVSHQTRQTHSEIDWTGIAGLRNRIVHDYRSLDLDRIWKIVQDEVPILIPQLEALVPPEEA